jgi:hypothetical protein
MHRRREFKRAGWLLAVLLSGVLTLIEQKWVGGLTIYAPDRRAVREMLHETILTNQLPDSVSSWKAIGANGLGIRPLAVWTAEGIRRLTGWSIHRSYMLLETTGLFAATLLLCAFLQPITGWQFALASLLYWGCVLPLTYMQHSFHPWDRPNMVLWLLALICARLRSWGWLAVVLIVGMATKFDLLVFPVLLFLAFIRTEPLTRTLGRTAVFLGLTVSMYMLLQWMLPNGMEPRPVFEQIRANLSDLRDMWYYYPPLLALGAPAVLAAIGYTTADRFARACFLFAGIVAAILFLQVNFVEFRTEVPLLLLLLPAAWYGLQRITGNEPRHAGPELAE